jgi:hypothetical protein
MALPLSSPYGAAAAESPDRDQRRDDRFDAAAVTGERFRTFSFNATPVHSHSIPWVSPGLPGSRGGISRVMDDMTMRDRSIGLGHIACGLLVAATLAAADRAVAAPAVQPPFADDYTLVARRSPASTHPTAPSTSSSARRIRSAWADTPALRTRSCTSPT